MSIWHTSRVKSHSLRWHSRIKGGTQLLVWRYYSHRTSTSFYSGLEPPREIMAEAIVAKPGMALDLELSNPD